MKRPLFFLLLNFFLIFSFSTHAQYLGDLNSLSPLLKKIESEKVFLEESWLQLGHYQKNLLGYVSEVDGSSFFLSPLGKSSPKDELKDTLKSFYNPLSWYPKEKDHPQCRFLARRAWILERLKIKDTQLQKLPCDFHQQWKRKLDAESVSLIFASSYMNNPSSMFGHTFMKFRTRGQSGDKDLLNYGVNFAATTGSDGGMAFMLKGLFGGYPGEYSLTPYYLKLQEYSNLEGRDIWEYELALTPEEVDRLIDHLFELEQTYFDYYFFSENCSYQLLGLLDWARPTLNLRNTFFYHVIPADTIRVIAQSEGLVRQVRFRPALRQNLEARLDLLTPQEKALAQEFFSSEDTDQLLTNLSAHQQEQQAALLDTALAYGALKEFRDYEKWKDPVFKLKTARAKIPVASRRLELTSPEGPPHLSHPPARLNVGPGYQKKTLGYLDVGFRFAYHELTDSDEGLLSGSQIQFLAGQARWLHEREKVQLTRLRLFDLVSLSSWGSYQKPLSWKAAFGYENAFHEDMVLLSGGAGSTWELVPNRWTFSIFADAEAGYNKDFKNSHILGVGPSFLTRMHFTQQWRLLLRGQSLWETSLTRWRYRSQAEMSYNFNHWHQVRLHYENLQGLEDSGDEVSLLWEFYFLL